MKRERTKKNTQVMMMMQVALRRLMLPLVALLCFSSAASHPTFSGNKRIEKIVVHPQTGDVYVAAVNRIYLLSDSLVKQQEHVTGPKHSDGRCFPKAWNVPPENICDDSKALTDFHNQLFLLNETSSVSSDTLVVCGSVVSGECNFYSAENVSSILISAVEVLSKSSTVHVPVLVGTEATLSTAAVIATAHGDSALYVATYRERSSLQLVTKPVMNVVSLERSDLLKQLGSLDFTQWIGMGIESRPRQSFTSGQFVYFTSYQEDRTNTRAYRTVLSRICKDDSGLGSSSSTLYGYMEATIKCQNSSHSFSFLTSQTIFNPGKALQTALNLSSSEDLLIALFAETYDKNTDILNGDFAVCIYKMADIEQKFKETQDKCRKGDSSIMKGFERDGTNTESCTDLTAIWNEQSCSPPDGTSVLLEVGSVILSQPAFIKRTFEITSVAVAVVGKSTVAFFGTANGHLLKMILPDLTTVTEISNTLLTELTTSTEIHSLAFSLDNKYLFAVSESEVVKVPVETCSSLKSCDQCVASNDPFCGFCVLENKCSVQSECQMSGDVRRWIQTDSLQCIVSGGLKQGSPKIAPITKAVQISLEVSNVPDIGSFECVFGTIGSTTANRASQVISCNTPTPAALPDANRDSLSVSVSLKSTATNAVFVIDITNITVFDCRIHRKCSNCTANSLPCGWCLYNSVCTDSYISCRDRQSSYRVEHKDLCPKLTGNENFWPSGVNGFKFLVNGQHFPNIQRSGDEYECIVKVHNENTFTVSATRVSESQLQCTPDSTQIFKYSNAKEIAKAKLDLIWKVSGRSNYELEKEDGFSLTLFKCGQSATDCSECLAVDPQKRKCGWCSSNGACTVELECTAGWNGKESVDCPEPFISTIAPKRGPIEGGTKLTIKGSNLGVRFQDIVSVKVNDQECDLREELYSPGKTIGCYTRPAAVGTGPVKVTINKASKTSKDHFEYTMLGVTEYSPKLGPSAGGTEVRIRGTNLDIGDNVTVILAQQNCDVRSRKMNEIVCVTLPFIPSLSSIPSQPLDGVVLRIDNATNSSLMDQKFIYTPNPTIKDIDPKQGLKHGGVILKVTGTWLNSVQNAKIVFRNDMWSARSDCKNYKTNQKVMACVQPPFPESVRQDVSLNVTFEMDGVPQSSLQLSGAFVIKPDPVFEMLKPDYSIDTNDHIVLEGTNLDIVMQQLYTIYLGKEIVCNITNFAGNIIRCSPVGTVEDGQVFEITVTIGNFSKVLGNVEYVGSSSISIIAIAVPIAVIAGLAVVAIICIVLIARQRSIKREAHVQKLLVQMDRLESTVAKECKQGFTELQTDLDDLGQALSSDHLPLLPFKQYAMRVLFPRDEDHVVLHPLSQRLNSRPKLADEKIRQGTDLFLSLIRNKNFLVKFIQCMESEISFTMKDRTEVASLLMVICQDRMDYATDILKRLLSLLIHRSIGKSHPKLLLRRTESVAEKLLTNWLTFCLQQHIQESVGKPLYTLFRAVKSQIEKGPVDAITGESRYALSEDKLLRHQVDYREMKFTVVDQSVGSVQVKLLDLDTISQAKDKVLDAVYKTTGVSQRPAVSSVDLSLVPRENISQPALRFRDEDSTTVTEREWKRVNTIKHYNIPEFSPLALSPRDGTYANARHTDHTQMLIASPSRSVLVEEEGGMKFWHLTKQVDTIAHGGDHKLVSEIYLTRMLSTKRIVQKFVDDLFDAIFPPARDAPFPIKYLFNFLDNEAAELSITDPDILHAWKTNSVPLRFWINVIKNPDFVFDIHKSTSVDSCLSVIAQTFMDGCSVANHKLSKDSPSSKLLYNKEVQQYKQRVQRYYSDLQSMPRISEADMVRYMREVSQAHGDAFDQQSALYELFRFAHKYKNQIGEELVVEASLSRDFHRVLETMQV